MFLLSLQSNQEKVWKFPKFFTDTYWLEGELHYIKYLKEAFILRPIKLFYQCLLSVIKNFLKFKKKIKSSLRYFWKKCDLFTPLFSQKNLIRIQSLRYIFLVLSIPIWVQWWLKFSTPLWKNLLLFLMSWVTLVYPQCDPSYFALPHLHTKLLNGRFFSIFSLLQAKKYQPAWTDQEWLQLLMAKDYLCPTRRECTAFIVPHQTIATGKRKTMSSKFPEETISSWLFPHL